MNLKAINICMHELGEVPKIYHQLIPNLVICFDKKGNNQMHSIADAINGVTIYSGGCYLLKF